MIAHPDLQYIPNLADVNTNLPAVLARVFISVDGIHRQIGQYLTELARVTVQDRFSGSAGDGEGTLGEAQTVSEEQAGVLQGLEDGEGPLLSLLQIAGVEFETANVRGCLLHPLLGGADQLVHLGGDVLMIALLHFRVTDGRAVFLD